MLAVVWVPEHHLVVVTGGDNGAIGALVETPDLTVGVRLHDVGVGAVLVAGDGAITLADDELAVAAVDGTDQGWELDAVLDGAVAHIDAVDLAVFGAREELAISETESANEALVQAEGLLALATVGAAPDVDLAVGATGVADAIAVPSRASEGGLLVLAEETLLLVTASTSGIPEVHVLDTGS